MARTPGARTQGTRTMTLIGVQPSKSGKTRSLAAAPDLFDPAELTRAIETISAALEARPDTPVPDVHALALSSVSIELGVDATGKVGIIVSSGEVTVSGKITVTFERQP
jgi:hypothetical protein